jgi:hypothetical protein
MVTNYQRQLPIQMGGTENEARSSFLAVLLPRISLQTRSLGRLHVMEDLRYSLAEHNRSKPESVIHT